MLTKREVKKYKNGVVDIEHTRIVRIYISNNMYRIQRTNGYSIDKYFNDLKKKSSVLYLADYRLQGKNNYGYSLNEELI